MSNEFTNYLADRRYVTGYGWNGKGIVYIEDETDTLFWEEMFEDVYPNEYEFKSSFRHDGSRGKHALKELIPNLHDKCIIAIDADHDYICTHNVQLNEALDAAYVMHTCCYSRESVLFSFGQLLKLKSRIKLQKACEVDVCSIIKRVSISQYELFLGYLYLLNNGDPAVSYFNPYSALKSIKFRDVLNYDFSLKEHEFEKLEQKTKVLKDFIYENIDVESEAFGDFKIKSEMKGFSSETAYRFISGHVLCDSIILPLFTRIKFLMERRDIKSIELEVGPGEQRVNMISHVRKYYKESCNLKTLIHSLSVCNEDLICLMIKDKLSKIRPKTMH